MAVVLGFLLAAGLCIVGVVAQGHGHHASMLCLSCDNIRDPHDCTHLAKCHPEEMCYTEVNQDASGDTLFSMYCKPRHECEHMAMVGRRDLQCQQCCGTSGCNKDLCGDYRSTMMSTTVGPASMTTTDDGTCMDHEEDGFTCAHYDAYNFCTDPDGFAFVFAHEKCPKHCGFCGNGGN